MENEVVTVHTQCEYYKVYLEVFGHSPYYSLPDKERFPMVLGHIGSREVNCQKRDYDKFVSTDTKRESR